MRRQRRRSDLHEGERGPATPPFQRLSRAGRAIAPFLVIWLYQTFGGLRLAFMLTGTLGFIWAIAWRFLYHRPEEHPRISEKELAMIRQNGQHDSYGIR